MCVKYLQVLYHHQSEVGDVISSKVLIQSCWCHGGHTVGFAHCHLFQLLYLSELKAELGKVDGFPYHSSARLSSVLGLEVLSAHGPYPGRVALASWEAQVQAAGAWLQVPMPTAG